MSELYPLRFRPLFRQYIWGGRRLETVLEKPIGDGDNYAECWEVVDLGRDQSIVADGPLQNEPLHEIVTKYGQQLFGKHQPTSRFPILFKFLDANRNLSVQVHPDDRQAATLSPPGLGKTEAWVILDAKLGSQVYAGLKRGFDRHALEREVARGTADLCLHRFEPKPGDCIFVPAGTVHALGAGLLVAEIQQASDTTYRLYDWNRVSSDGRPRALHIEQALSVIDYHRGPVDPVIPEPTESVHVVRLVKSNKFIMDRWTVNSELELATDNCFHLVAVLTGRFMMTFVDGQFELSRGQTALVPACTPAVQLSPIETATLLDIYLPECE